MRRGAAIALLLGLGLFIALIVYEGADDVVAALAAASWGMVLVAAFHLIPMMLDAAGLYVVLPRRGRAASYPAALRARWVGESVNNLLPVAQMGGLLVMVRMLARPGRPGSEAGAAVTVTTTQQMLTQAVFALIGIILFAVQSDNPVLLWALTGGIVLFGISATGFYRLQQRGFFEKLAGLMGRVSGGRDWLGLSGGAVALDAAIHDVYQRGGAVRASFGFNLAGWLMGTGEVWLALYFIGTPVDLLDAMMLESLGQAIRGIAFLVPGALGVQEGGYVLLGSVVGLSADTALALSLVKRVRELAQGLPGLLYWQWTEGRRLRRASRDALADAGGGSQMNSMD